MYLNKNIYIYIYIYIQRERDVDHSLYICMLLTLVMMHTCTRFVSLVLMMSVIMMILVRLEQRYSHISPQILRHS